VFSRRKRVAQLPQPAIDLPQLSLKLGAAGGFTRRRTPGFDQAQATAGMLSSGGQIVLEQAEQVLDLTRLVNGQRHRGTPAFTTVRPPIVATEFAVVAGDVGDHTEWLRACWPVESGFQMTESSPTVPLLTIYRRPGCHLCDEARQLLQAELEGRASRGEPVPRVREVDIDGDEALHDRYYLRIPVLAMGNDEIELVSSTVALRRFLDRNLPALA
jgi:Glutaredoxin-like domain (DUF836)